MKKKNHLAILLIVVVAVLAWLLKRSSFIHLTKGQESVVQTNVSVRTKVTDVPVGNSSALIQSNKVQNIQAQVEQDRQAIKNNALLWRRPILYYGKVLDESNQPIVGVQVPFNTSSVNELLTQEKYDAGTAVTDARGIFKIDGVRGIGMVFQLSHSNYYPNPKNITDFDFRDYPQRGNLPNTEENALIFYMHSKGHPVPLVHRRGGADVPVNTGQAIVNLYGEQDGQMIGSLQIQAWGDTPKNWSPTPYDWNVQITLPNGGFVESTNQFDFVAPDTGYQPTIKIKMDKDQPGWSDTVVKTYFVKLASGYLRMGIRMRAKTPLYVSLDYYYNPDGSTDLESDK